MRPIPVLKALLIIELFVFMKTREKVNKTREKLKKIEKTQEKPEEKLTFTHHHRIISYKFRTML
jgi:hypothetical protein